MLKLGDQLNGTIVKPIGGRRFLVKCGGVPSGWRVELHTLRPELAKEGTPATFWVAKVAPLQGKVLVHDGDFGRLPISDAMRPRYTSALRALLGQIELDSEVLADAGSMISRIGKRQEADWLTVWRLLGEIPPGEANILLAEVKSLRIAFKEKAENLDPLRAELSEKYGRVFSKAIQRLEKL
ncbi:MAG: hypothetical protein H7Y17_08915 [Chlorobia bacterium]|nr:hypothetical protein [Fimbriimonadaceae bacterium]